ncbi:hypothetical protein LR48_Vigan09g188600 [Vigna angularis]|uniref:Uncharacterized protein n=2 Tax=Phaseolus angularis TaxID=3914 RepID=A0A0L9VE70_PHAAN|nr:uncharacterized protein LOC108342339 [Vigna angularis]KAG2395560.1 uncharacterized protein HKW66_Vig0070640 [Vigna angularis]KOM53227.1 hypothetical protein LR48_Vigan09g188600 [Vigna angularis]BAT87618.1 hypothetical protein VIGAN_05100800 [Vigna angularis var. angularis]
MGCFSSKVIARSISFHEERKKRSQRASNGIPLLEDLIISSGGSDQYLALVCAANTVSNKLHSGNLSSNTSSKLAIEPAISETIKNLKPVSERLVQGEGKKIDREKKNRSKSWHQFPEHIVQSLAQENSSGFDDKHDSSSKGAARSKSFHTVEEYDDIVEKIWSSKCHTNQQSEFNDEEDSGSGSNTTHHTDYAVKRMQVPSLIKKHSLKERKIVKESKNLITAASESSTEAPSPSPNNKSSIIEKGNKRKAVAKRLESLRIPSSVEYPAIASLREWLPKGGIYSPGSYVTPKFGSYSIMDISNANESSEDSIFSPELVSAFEHCMKKLEAEEENILKQIVEHVDEESEASSTIKKHYA